MINDILKELRISDVQAACDAYTEAAIEDGYEIPEGDKVDPDWMKAAVVAALENIARRLL